MAASLLTHAVSPVGLPSSFSTCCCSVASYISPWSQSSQKLSRNFSFAVTKRSIYRGTQEGYHIHQSKREGSCTGQGTRRFRNKTEMWRKRVVMQSSQDDHSSEPQESAKSGLQALDEQLRFLADQNGSANRVQVIEDKKVEEMPQTFKLGSEEDFPDLDGGFLVFFGIGLLVLTLVNNVLFKLADKFFAPEQEQEENIAEVSLLNQTLVNASLTAPSLSLT